MKAPLLLLSLLAPLPALAQEPPPFTHGNAEAGRALAERDCVACHAQRYEPASAIYTRKDRRVTSASQLLAQVQRCNVELGAGYFPEEEENVAAHLNRAYYKFTP